MNKITLLLFICIPSQSLFPQWVLQEKIIGNDLYDIFFYDNLNGWVVGSYGTILHTSDGGNNWNIQNSGIDAELNSVIFCSPEIGWAAGNSGYILKTTNGGNDWIIIRGPVYHDYTNVFFLDQNNGWAGNSHWDTVTNIITNSLLRSTDGGESWNTQVQEFDQLINNIHFFNSSKGVLNTWGWENSGMWLTTDGGNTWKQSLKTYPYTIKAFYFINENTGWAVSYTMSGDRRVHKTTNGGESWTSQNINFYTYVNDIFFTDELNGWISGYEGIIYTSDGGNTWTDQIGSGNKIFFSDKMNGWIVGNEGKIYKYSKNRSVKLLTPESSDELMPYYRCSVSWSSNLVDTVRADYSTDNGNSWINIIRNVPKSTYSEITRFNWKIISGLTSDFLLRIMDESDPTVFDIKQLQMKPLRADVNRTKLLSIVEGQKFNKIIVNGNYAYISALEKGIYIYDISNPYEPQYINRYQTEGWAWKAFYKDGKLYVAEASSGLTVLNVQDPENISQVGKYAFNGPAVDVYVKDSIALVADMWYGLKIVNVKDPSNITEISKPAGSGYNLIYCNLPYVYAGRGNYVDIIDVSDLKNPRVISTININLGYVEKVFSIAAENNILTIGGYYCIQNYDVSDKAHPELLGLYKNDWDAPEETLIWSVTGIIIENNTGYAADVQRGLNIFSPLDSAEIRIDGFFHTKSVPWGYYQGEFSGLAKKDSILYLTDKENGLYILTLTDTPVSVNEEIPERALSFHLDQNYPNPFNPSTVIRYTVPEGAGLVSLKVYDLLGKEIATLVNEEKSPGTHQVVFDGSNLSSGVYFYQMHSGNYSEIKKFILLR